MRDKAGDSITGPQLEMLKRRTFYGREKDKRTPQEILEFIAEKGHEADAALGRLGKLVAIPSPVMTK